ncbi:MAG: class I SAM-dependent RNA methyltransferase [Ignavibacteria bacterium]|nr:class I SAM-dependent RNA methyltransferase [Ignavibacteria bacterium]
MILVTCPKETPQYLATEIRNLGFTVDVVHKAGVELTGTFDDCMKLNLWLRTAHRVLYKLGGWKCRTTDEMYARLSEVAWEDVIAADGYVSVISSVKTAVIDNDMYANMRCKDAIVDRIRSKKGIRPDSGSSADRTVVFLYWHDDELIVYLDTSGNVLSNRGYRLHPAKAPLRETLAASIIMATRWSPEFPFVNPMAGSGTLGIEAALMSRNIAPGSLRRNFGFMHCLQFDYKKWDLLLDEAHDVRKSRGAAQIICSDHDARALRLAKDNAKEAGVLENITWKTCEFDQTPVPDVDENPPNIFDDNTSLPVVIMNPEYGLRLGDTEDLKATYGEIGDFFKQRCAGYAGYVFTGNLELAKHVGLRSKRRIPFYTADIDSRLLEFLLYKGGRNTEKTEEQPVEQPAE